MIKNSHTKFIDLYFKVCDCYSDKCRNFPEIYNRPDLGSPPRGFYTESTGTVEILVVGKNPGHVLPSEAERYKNLSGIDLVKAHLNFSRGTFFKQLQFNVKERQSTTFHSNLNSYLMEILDAKKENIFKQCAYTNLVKCSTTDDEQKQLSIRSMNECFNTHLSQEIDFFKPKMILALGREVEKYLLKVKKISYPIAYVKHPSYHYKKELREIKINELKNLYRQACF